VIPFFFVATSRQIKDLAIFLQKSCNRISFKNLYCLRDVFASNVLILNDLCQVIQNSGETGQLFSPNFAKRMEVETVPSSKEFANMASNISHWVPTLGMGQKTVKQCWYASYKMIYWYKGKNIDSIKGKVSSEIDFDDAMANGLLDTDFSKVATALGMQKWSGVEYKKPHGTFDVGLTDGTEAFLELLEKGPLWVSRFISTGSYHITVARKYDDDGKGYIHYNNPFPGPKDAVEGRMAANLYTKHITNAMGSIQR